MLFRRKKAILDFAFISLSSREDFVKQLKKEITIFQGQGFEVDVKYSLDGSFSALILAYEVK